MTDYQKFYSNYETGTWAVVAVDGKGFIRDDIPVLVDDVSEQDADAIVASPFLQTLARQAAIGAGVRYHDDCNVTRELCRVCAAWHDEAEASFMTWRSVQRAVTAAPEDDR